jgi:hypothetical protein
MIVENQFLLKEGENGVLRLNFLTFKHPSLWVVSRKGLQKN